MPGEEGVVLDARPHPQGGVELTLHTPRGLERVRLNAGFRAYLKPGPHTPPHKLAQNLEEHAGVKAWVEQWWTPPTYTSRAPIVVVEHPLLSHLEQTARRLEQRAIAHRVNPLPTPLSEALHRHGAWPCHRVRVNGGRARVLEDPGDPLYPPPPVRVARVTSLSWHGPRVSGRDRLEHYLVEVEGEKRRVGEGAGVLETAREMGATVLMGRPLDLEGLPLEEAGDLVVIEAPGLPLGFAGVFEWCRVSRLPLPQAAVASIGQVLTNSEALVALEEKMLLDPRAPRLEGWRSLGDLASADRAGLIRMPEPGLYWGVVQVDFNSLYPTLISRYNLSGETVGPHGCPGRRVRPEGAVHEVCMHRRGVVARVLGELVERRAGLKRALSRKGLPPGVRGVLEERASALKWVLVSGFGYLGYRNSLFGSIWAYENVTALARSVLLRAEEAARRLGYRVVHSMVDSLMLQPTGGEGALEGGSLARLTAALEEATGLPLKVEAVFTWLYIPPTRMGVGAANKYYGLLRDGGVKVRGVKAVRRDTPPFHALVQKAVIARLAQARSPPEMAHAVERAWGVVERARRLLSEAKVPPRGLVVRRRRSLPGVPGLRPRGVVEEAFIRVVGGWWPVERGPPPPGRVDWGYYLGVLDRVVEETPLAATA